MYTGRQRLEHKLWQFCAWCFSLLLQAAELEDGHLKRAGFCCQACIGLCRVPYMVYIGSIWGFSVCGAGTLRRDAPLRLLLLRIQRFKAVKQCPAQSSWRFGFDLEETLGVPFGDTCMRILLVFKTAKPTRATQG